MRAHIKMREKGVLGAGIGNQANGLDTENLALNFFLKCENDFRRFLIFENIFSFLRISRSAFLSFAKTGLAYQEGCSHRTRIPMAKPVSPPIPTTPLSFLKIQGQTPCPPNKFSAKLFPTPT
jgi:hypothetical protein